jgi:2-oxoglutarate ferredoxin oxidoreductase subunit beta
MATKSTPGGNLEQMLNPLALALAAGCGYVARGFSGDPKHLVQLCKAGILHRGFALIDVFSPCVTFNKHNTFHWFRERVYRLEDEGHNSSDFQAAMDKALEWGARIPVGLFYQNPAPRPSLDDLDPTLHSGPLCRREVALSLEKRRKLVEEFI